MTSLNKMQPGQRGRVVAYFEDSPIARRLVELGMVPGRQVRYLRDAPLRDPLEVQVGATCLTLRHAEAALIAVEIDE